MEPTFDSAVDKSFAVRLGREGLAELRAAGQRREFRAGELLFLEGDAPGCVLLVESGLVRVHVTAATGPELILGIYGRGELLCEMSALERGPRSATGVGQRAGVVTEIPGARFRAFVRKHPETMIHVLSLVQYRLRRADRERLSYLSDDVPARVARRLLDWATRYGTTHANGRVEVTKFSRRELAQSVAASEKTVDDVLSTLTSAGLIDTGRLRFMLLNPAKLRIWATARPRR